jgi:hypothetical protein
MPLFYGKGDNARRRLREQIERAYGYRIPDRIQEDDNDDTASIHSVDSISSTLTGSSITLVGEVQAAADEFVVALLEDQNVKPLLAAAFDRMAADRLQRNIKRLLKVYASNLQAEAKGEVEKKAADLVLGRARYISYRTCQQYDKSVPSKAGNFEQLKFRDSERRDLLESYLQSMMSQTTDDAGDDDDERQYSDVSSEDETDQPDLSDLARVKSFLFDSLAYRAFKQNLQDFVFPPKEPAKRDTELAESLDRTNFGTWNRIRMKRVEILLGLRMLLRPFSPARPQEDHVDLCKRLMPVRQTTY